MKFLHLIIEKIRLLRSWYRYIWNSEDHDNVYKTPYLNVFTRIKNALLGT